MTPDIPTLKRRADFLRAARVGRKWVTPGLILQKRRRADADAASVAAGVVRVGFTTSRKVGKAVVRNRVRRRLRAAAREILPRQAEAGCDYVIIGRSETVTRPFAALLDDLATALTCLRRGESEHGGARRRRSRPSGAATERPGAAR
ncbi:MAG: ribonuclease P protein component [Rhodospirillales bacterium]|nr:ribonuclease P protein component [Rhodospirillales bacterium]